MARQLEFESRALSGAFTGGDDGTSHAFCGEGSAMKSEAVASLAGGEAVLEDTSHVVSGDADAVITNFEANPIFVAEGA